MINEQELDRALRIKNMTYNLLMWLNSAIKNKIISPEKAIEYTASFYTAKNWIVEHYNNLPIDSRPDSIEFKDVEPFTYMFLSVFNSSFVIETEPRQRYVPHLHRTNATYVDKPHIRTKKLYAKDKLNARKLKIKYLQDLIIEQEIQFDSIYIENLVDDLVLKEKIALTTYGLQLIERLKGFNQGLEVLALWREFAWNPKGSPKKKFKLDSKLIIDNEKLIFNELNKKAQHTTAYL